MFGKKFGAFRTQNRHFFDNNSPIYVELSKILKIRKNYIALNHGRQFLREISKKAEPFHYPKKISDERISSVVCWSRIFNDEEFVLAINTDTIENQEVYAKIDPNINSIGDVYEYIYSDNKVIIGKKVIVEQINDVMCIKIHLSNSGRVLLKLKEK